MSFGVSGLDNETAIFNNLLIYRNYAISPPTARKLLELYPNYPAHEPPYYITDATIFPSKGLQWRRDCAIAGDIVMISGRRKVCVEYTKAGLNVFSYRFDTPLVSKLETTCNRISGCLSVSEVLTSCQWNAAVTAGAQHFVNVVFSFRKSPLYPSFSCPPVFNNLTPYKRTSQALLALSQNTKITRTCPTTLGKRTSRSSMTKTQTPVVATALCRIGRSMI